MNYKIDNRPAFYVMGISHSVKTSEAFTQVPQIWEEAWKNGSMQRLLENISDDRPAGLLGVAVNGQWGNAETMNYTIAVTSYVGTDDSIHHKSLDGMVELFFPSAQWIIFEANGDLPNATQNVYHYFYSEWLPNSDYKVGDLPVIECYMQDNQQEVWIAIEPK